ncbi:MAG: ethanolamine ammonia-lyase subunit EutB [Rubripirellula sp.]|nr:ethanolamine ammonia-lyase subunit EutB [Rubripirellula sp.]
MINRRVFLVGGAAGGTIAAFPWSCPPNAVAATPPAPAIASPNANEGVFEFIHRMKGKHDPTLYAQVLGAANNFKEGDAAIGVAAADETSRQHARTLLNNTSLKEIDEHSLHQDEVQKSGLRAVRTEQRPNLTLGGLKRFLLKSNQGAIQQVMPGLSSDVIGCVCKLMTNEELTRIGAKVFNPLPGTMIGEEGYLGARIQPNSPTDNIDDILWQVLDGWSYAVGDVLLGTNPVSSDPRSVKAIELALQELLVTFGIDDLMPHCVLAHIDVQSEVEQAQPGSTQLFFQSIGGCDESNATFDTSVQKLAEYADQRKGRFGLYFETGQGADFTNGHGLGFDMLLHESRKYGLARELKQRVANAQAEASNAEGPWVHLNDVAGFIGPEVFRTREQLVRCCLEDIVMGKLHGLCIGLDVCSTLHMDVTLDDLDWCLDQIMPACPAYLMALPTKIDPMLGYLTTGFQDHVRLRERFNTRVNDDTWAFFKRLGVIDETGNPTEHFGDPQWVFLQYQRAKGDQRKDAEILTEGERRLSEVRGRGVFVAEKHGQQVWELAPELQSDITRIYDDAKQSIWAELQRDFITEIPAAVGIHTQSADREDYILHPTTGEQLEPSSLQRIDELRHQQNGKTEIQIVISDGLNALAIQEDDQLLPFLTQFRQQLRNAGMSVGKEHLVVTSGRVRAGYRIGERLFAGLKGNRIIAHIIGERPGTGHRTFSVYLTAADGKVWSVPDQVDHNITKVISGIATTALDPNKAALQTARLVANL